MQCFISRGFLAVVLLVLFGCTASAKSRYYGGFLCAYPEFKCVSISRGDTWATLFPNPREREIVKKLNRTNMPVNRRPWIIVPTRLKQVGPMDLSPFPERMNTGGEKVLLVNLSAQAFAAYNAEGEQVHWGPISAGKGWCKKENQLCETKTGSFRIADKQGPHCVSKTFPIETNGGAPMPYCMNYYRGFALHGSTLPGYHASHGCVRLFFEDAKWLNEKFVHIGTRVIVTR